MFQIICGEYEDTRPVEMGLGARAELAPVFSSLVADPAIGNVVFTDQAQAELFVVIYNLGCTLRCDRAWVNEV